MTGVRKAYVADVEQLDGRQVRVICSTDGLDRTGEVVEQDGIQLQDFLANPIILWSHNPEHVLGTAIEVGIVNGRLTALIEFAPEGMSHKADEICAMVKAGIVKTVSIGFDDLETVPMDKARPKGPQRYLKINLLEISFVAIPANPEAEVIERAHHKEKAPMTATQEAPKPGKTKAAAPRAKGLYDTAQFAYAVMNLGWICEAARCEAVYEGDESELPGKLLEIVRLAGAALIAMTEEEVGELVAALSENIAEPGEELDDDEAVIVTTGHSVPHAKALTALLHIKRVVAHEKSGRKFSAATVKCLKDAMADHEEAMDFHRQGMAAHKKGMKAISDLLEDSDNHEIQTSDGTSESTGSEGGKAAPEVMTKEQRIERAKALAA